jgi:hypothetical protein
MSTNRRGFLARIFAGAIAAPAVTKLIEGGASPTKPMIAPIAGTQQVFLCGSTTRGRGNVILGIAGESIAVGQIVYVKAHLQT